MKVVKYFYLDESPIQPKGMLIRIDFDKLPQFCTSSSYQVLFARLLNLSYAQYLRFARDCFGAQIVGKNSTYPIVYYPNTKSSYDLVDLLNKQMTAIVWEKEHPDWRSHMKEEDNNVFNS